MLSIQGFLSKLSIRSASTPYLTLTILCLLSVADTYAQGDLFINPKRIVFEGKKISQEISLANIGRDTARYIVSFVQIRLKDNGDFQLIEKPDSGQNFADKNLRIFPRTVTLGPKETQVVKVQVYQKNNLLPGEYRSHLYFRAAAATNEYSTTQKDSATNVVVKITPVYGITIPVIIRSGENTSAVSFSAISFNKTENTPYKLSFRLNRTGNMSTYGDIKVEHVSTTGKTTPAGFIKGIAVYTPNKLRDIELNIDDKIVFNHHSGKLKLTYISDTDGKPVILSSAELSLH